MEIARLTPEIGRGNKIQVTTDWEGKFYIGIALKWDNEKVMVQLSMQGYVYVALHAFQNENLNDCRTCYTHGHKPFMERIIR